MITLFVAADLIGNILRQNIKMLNALNCPQTEFFGERDIGFAFVKVRCGKDFLLNQRCKVSLVNDIVCEDLFERALFFLGGAERRSSFTDFACCST